MTIVDEFRRDELCVLDRLVDGELSPAERRDLLAALDDEPGAWRRCALAFLEAQSWRWQLSRVAAEPVVAHAVAAAAGHAGAARGTRRGPFWSAYLAVAASLLVAFVLGTRFPTAGAPQTNPPQVAARPSVTPAANRGATPQDTVASAASENASATEPDGQPFDEPSWETLTLAPADDDADADTSHKIQVRAANAAAADIDRFAEQPSTMPAGILDQFEQEGWTITRERRLLPVDLSDGRRMIVPVEEIDIRYPEVTTF